MNRFRVKELIEEARRAGKKITLTAIAKDANVSVTTIWSIANDESKAPAISILQSIADTFTEALGRRITIDDLIEKEDSHESPSPPAGIGNVDVDSHRKIGQEDYAWLPLYSPEIPCGDLQQIEEEHIIDRLPFPKRLIGAAQFVLQAKGDSMLPSIKDGDLLLIEPGNHWDNKDIVIAWVDGEVTCKRLQINHSPALLVPDNRDYKVIPVNGETLILGRVVGRYEFAFIKNWKP